MNPALQVGVMQVGGGCVIIGGVFTWAAPVPVETSVTDTSYVNILANDLHHFRNFFPHQSAIF